MLCKTALVLLLTFICSLTGAHAQYGLVPMEQGLPGPVMTATAVGDTIYAIVNESSKTVSFDHGGMVGFYKWDGATWTKLKQLQVTAWWNDEASPKLIAYKDNIYLTRAWVIVNSKEYNFIKWNGQDWDSTAVGTGFVDNATIFKDKLIISGYFTKIGTKKCTRLASFDGTDWSYVGPSSADEGFTMAQNENHFISNLIADADRLYISSVTLSAPASSQQASGNILSWDGSQWSVLSDTIGNGYSKYRQPKLFMYKNQLYSLTTGKCRRWDGSVWSDVSSGLQKFYRGINWNVFTRAGEEYQGKLWVSIKSYTPGTTLRMFYWNDTSWVDPDFNIHSPEDTITSIVRTSKGMYVFGALTAPNGKDLKNAAKISEHFGKVRGVVFHDENANCNHETSEYSINNQLLEITPGPIIINADSNGIFSATLDTGTYNIRCLSKRNWVKVCPDTSNVQTIKISSGTEIPNLNFGIKPKSNINDLHVSVTGHIGFRARAGFYEKYTLEYENMGTTKLSGKIVLKHGPQASKFSATPAPDELKNGRAAWYFTDLKPEQKAKVTFTVRIDSAAKIGDTVAFVVHTDSANFGKDAYIADNADTLKQRIVASLDPNDKQSWPEGNIALETKEVKYMIRFQNEGTDTAYRVVVIDTLDMRLPITKVQLNGTSHPYRLEIRKNVIKWTFDNILLPPKNQDEAKSQGYLTFVTALKPGMAKGTEIQNRAHIYFDYQKPVITNYAMFRLHEIKVIDTVTAIGSIIQTKSLALYPNPAANEVHINNRSTQSQIIYLFDATGRMMDTILLRAGEVHSLNTSSWNNGLYLIRTSAGERGKVVIQH